MRKLGGAGADGVVRIAKVATRGEVASPGRSVGIATTSIPFGTALGHPLPAERGEGRHRASLKRHEPNSFAHSNSDTTMAMYSLAPLCEWPGTNIGSR